MNGAWPWSMAWHGIAAFCFVRAFRLRRLRDGAKRWTGFQILYCRPAFSWIQSQAHCTLTYSTSILPRIDHDTVLENDRPGTCSNDAACSSILALVSKMTSPWSG